MKRALILLLGVALAVVVAASAASSPRRDFAATARSILPPGQSGGVTFDRHSVDQIAPYDALTPLFGRVSARDVQRYFKPAGLWKGTEKAARVQRPKAGVRILRDGWGVPHVFAARETDVMFGAGWAAAEDRGLLMELARGPGRVACLDVPGLDAFAVALSGRSFVPSTQTEAFLDAQVALLRAQGAIGRRVASDAQAYVNGVNAYRRSQELPIQPWTLRDVVAMVCLLGQRFGAGGGDEVRRSMLLDSLRRQLGAARGTSVWNDLRLQMNPETPVSAPGTFAYEPASAPGAGNAVIDAGSFKPVGTSGDAQPLAHRLMSNAILLSGRRSATGKPIMVAGPQLGFFYPEFFMELDLHGGAFDVRGGMLAGIPLVLIGRGPDYAWSATSSQSDNVDVFAEELCGDDLHYRYRGACLAMTVFDAGTLRSPTAQTPLSFRQTVHGPVFGYGTTGGRRVALSFRRASRGREFKSAIPLYRLNTAAPRSARGFLDAVSAIELSFNLFYVDDRSIAMYSAGLLPQRAPGVDPGVPTIGNGDHEWRGFLSRAGHPQAVNPAGGQIVNWNNKPGRGFGSADDNWTFGPVHRVTMLGAPLKAGRNTVADAVSAMNQAATQDIRAVVVWTVIRSALAGSPAPSTRAERMVQLLDAWRAARGSRLDRDLDGRIDDPGAAIMDAAWPGIADAVMRPVLGPVTDELAALVGRFDLSMAGAWLNYVYKDLRWVGNLQNPSPFANRYCGGGDAADCRRSLWAAIDAAGAKLAASQGSDPAAWRADATAERIRFAPGILPNTMRGANRPTFQQVMSFRSHRPSS